MSAEIPVALVEIKSGRRKKELNFGAVTQGTQGPKSPKCPTRSWALKTLGKRPVPKACI